MIVHSHAHSICSASPPTIGIVSVTVFHYSDEYEVVSLCGFNFNFSVPEDAYYFFHKFYRPSGYLVNCLFKCFAQSPVCCLSFKNIFGGLRLWLSGTELA